MSNSGTPDVERRPSHIVAFRRVTEDNLKLLIADLNLVRSEEPKAAGIEVLVHPDDSRIESRLYFKLGVGALHLTRRQVEALRADRTVRSVLPNRLRVITENTEFPDRGEVPGPNRRIRRNGARIKPPSGPLTDIGIQDGYGLTGANIKVAVLDTGIDLTHPDFTGRVAEGQNAVSFIPYESVQDGHGHGTHCTGIVAGPVDTQGNARFGVAPNVELLIAKVMGDDGKGWDDHIIEGLDWAREQGAQIVSMSFGGPREGEPNAAYEQAGLELRQAGALPIAGVGNDSNREEIIQPILDPAAAPSIVAVGAVDNQFQIAHFSNQADEFAKIDLCAPGVKIYSSYKTGTWWPDSGTSMATAHVSGVAALYLEQNPQLTPGDLQQALENNAQTLGPMPDYGHGLVRVP